MPRRAWDRSERVALRIDLSLRVVNAARTAECAQTSLLWTFYMAPTNGHLMGAAGAGGGPWRRVPGRAVRVRAAATAGNSRPVRTQPDTAETYN